MTHICIVVLPKWGHTFYRCITAKMRAHSCRIVLIKWGQTVVELLSPNEDTQTEYIVHDLYKKLIREISLHFLSILWISNSSKYSQYASILYIFGEYWQIFKQTHHAGSTLSLYALLSEKDLCHSLYPHQHMDDNFIILITHNYTVNLNY